MFASTTGGVTEAPFAARLLASSDWSATEFGFVYVSGSLTDGTYVWTPTTSPLLSTSGMPMQPVLDTTVNRAAPGLADAVHFTGGWLPQEEAIDASPAIVASTTAGTRKRLWV